MTATRSFHSFLAVIFSVVSIACPSWAADNRKQVEAALFDSSKLLDIQIEMAPADWEALAGQSRNFAASFAKTAPVSPYTYFRADVSINGVRIPSVGVRKKGFFGSMDGRRPSLKVKFDEFQKNGKLGGLDRLTLNNNKQDQAHISQILSYKMFRKAGLPAPRCNLARVSVNGKPLGVYGHVESIKTPFLQRQFGDATGEMFEGVFPCDFYPDRIGRFEAKTNKKKPNRSDLEKIAAILAKPDAELKTKLANYFDIDEFIRHWATEVMIGFWDGYAGNQNNFYLYKDPADGKFHFIPWGADFAFSNQFQRGPKSIKAKGLMTFHLYQVESVREEYRSQLIRLLETVWNEVELLAEVDRVAKLVEGHLHEDQRGFSRALAGARGFIKNRKSEILAEIKDGAVPFDTRPTKPMYYEQVGTVNGRFAATWRTNGSNSDAGEGQVELVVDGAKQKLSKLAVSAQPGRARGGFGGRPGPPGPPPPTLTLKFERADEAAGLLTLTLTVPADQFRSSDQSIDVQGMMSEGEGGFRFGPGMRAFVGTITLDSAEQRDGAKVAGRVQGKLFQMRGGFGGPRRSNR